MRLVFDIEADGLLDTFRQVWCITAKDIDTGEVYQWDINTQSSIIEFVTEHLSEAEELIGHNIIQYDLPLLATLIGWTPSHGTKITDTLVLSRLLNPDRPKPPNYKGKGGPHSLEAWGYRVGRYKPDHEDWSQFSKEMLIRNVEDVEINCIVYGVLQAEIGDWDWSEAIRIEHEIARIIFEQERHGILFDKLRAREYIRDLTSKIESIDEEVIPKLPKTLVRIGSVPINNPFLKVGGYRKQTLEYIVDAYPGRQAVVGGPFNRIRFDNFDLGSTEKIKKYLLDSGWIPDNYNYSKTTGERTSPKLDGNFNGVDGEIPKKVKERITWRHRRSQIEGWLERLRPDGRLSAGANPCGTNTGRMRHHTVVNIPKANADKETGELIWDTENQKDIFGTQMRSLFIVPEGYKLVGHDASGLELRMLAHYMNDEEFTEQILSGDIHEYNRNLAGLPDRDAAKTFIYALIYGAGDAKIGSIIGGTADDGAELKRRFFRAIPKLEKLINSVKRASGKGYLKGLDGRKIWMRRGDDGRIQRSRALNTLLQNAGSIVMKQSCITLWEEIDGNKNIRTKL